MELTAAIEGLRALKEGCDVEVVTDSEYLKNGITTWIHGWKRNGWKTAAKKPVLNQDLWIELDELVQNHQVRWTWTKGHAGHDGQQPLRRIGRAGGARADLTGRRGSNRRSRIGRELAGLDQPIRMR